MVAKKFFQPGDQTRFLTLDKLFGDARINERKDGQKDITLTDVRDLKRFWNSGLNDLPSSLKKVKGDCKW